MSGQTVTRPMRTVINGTAGTYPVVQTVGPSPTWGPLVSCDLFLKPLWNRWTTAPANISAVGTTYLYIDPNANTTSTSVTCTPSILSSMTDSNGWIFGNNRRVSMDDKCTFYISVIAPPDRTEEVSSAPYTGQVSDFDLGPDITINYVGTKEPNSTHITAWQWSWWLPEGPQMYKGPATRVTTYYPDGSPADALWHLPDLSKMYPDLPDLSSCKGIHMETTPNQLTAARFLTERITMPKTTAGSLTVPAGHEPTATPAPRPTNPLPTPSEVSSPVPSPEQPVGRPGGGGSPASSGPSFPSDRPDSPSSPGNPARPAWTNAAGGNIGGTGHAPNGDSPAAQAPKITSPALILPGRQTLRPGGPASTVSGHIIALDNNGLVHVRPTSTSGSASGPGTVVSLQQIAAAGGIEVDGTRIPAFGTTIVEDASGPQAGSSGSNSISGGGVTSETGGQGSRVGSILSGIGTWVMSGLGASLTKPHNGTGPSTTQSGGQARNSSVISFTGEACIRTSLRAYFATSVIVVGMLLLL